MRGSGGTRGGLGLFAIGLVLAVVALYLFLDSVKVTTAGYGLITRGFHGGGRGGGFWETTSMGIVFVPFFIGVVALFYDHRMLWARWLTGIGIAVIVVEIVSRVHFLMTMKTTHFLGMIVLFAAGVALMLRSYREDRRAAGEAGDVPDGGSSSSREEKADVEQG